MNPRTTAVTDSFSISTSDSSSNAIEALSTGITVQMTSTPDMTAFSATPSSLTTGDTTTYLISATAALPILSTDSITFKFPDEITLPSTISCSG